MFMSGNKWTNIQNYLAGKLHGISMVVNHLNEVVYEQEYDNDVCVSFKKNIGTSGDQAPPMN